MSTRDILHTFFPFIGFLFDNHKGPSVNRYWNVRGRNNFTCVQLCIPFNFTVVKLSDYVLFKIYIHVTYLSDVPTSLLWAVDILNTFNPTSIQFTIVVLTWNYFTSNAIVLPMSFSAHEFWPGRTCFRCKRFPLFLN